MDDARARALLRAQHLTEAAQQMLIEANLSLGPTVSDDRDADLREELHELSDRSRRMVRAFADRHASAAVSLAGRPPR